MLENKRLLFCSQCVLLMVYCLGPKVLIKRWVLTSRATQEDEGGGPRRKAEGAGVHPPGGCVLPREAAVNLRRNLYALC